MLQNVAPVTGGTARAGVSQELVSRVDLRNVLRYANKDGRMTCRAVCAFVDVEEPVLNGIDSDLHV